jgi:hypothetical protein
MALHLVDKNVRITLINPKTWEHYDLYFRLYNTILARKWLVVMEKMKNGEKHIREKSVKFASSSSYDIEELSNSGKIEKLNAIIDSINTFYDKQIHKVTAIDQATLNYLHEEYEIYGNRLDEKLSIKWWDDAWKNIGLADPKANRWPGITFNEEFHATFLQLNDMIHTIERFFDPLLHNEIIPTYSQVNILVSHYPRIDYELTEEDCASFFAFNSFGDLSLGYNTLGKNIEHIISDEDQRAAEENAMVLQTTWSNEIMVRMETSKANPVVRTAQYHTFKELGFEQHGWKFGDHANREGYLLIGHMYAVQKDDIYSNQNEMLIDLTPFSDVHSVEIVSDKQMKSAYSNASLRMPSWKNPLPVQGKKIIEIKNEDTAIITWILNDICNYSCRYCPPPLHNGKNHSVDWSVVEPFIDQLFNHYSTTLGKKLQFSISGGEPTMSPFFSELVRTIYMKGGLIGITTNLARTSRFIEENFKYLSYAGCSFHPAQEFPNNTTDEWVEKVRIASTLTSTTVRLMMDPLYWDQCIDFIERIKNETVAALEIVFIDDQYGSSPTKISDITYSSEQLEFFKTFKTIPIRNTIAETNTFYRSLKNNLSYVYEDGTKQSNLSPQMLINKGQTNFFDYKCSIGKESLFIHQTGKIRRGNCHVGGIIGTLQEHKKIDWNSLLRTVICDSVRCSCGADIPISKKS